jgi:hypothetical protein
MSNKKKIAKRAAQAAAFTVGGGIALAFGMSGSAHADEIVVQSSEVTNAGVAAANSGGNVGVGNASTNVAANGQAAAGGLASNQASASNTSNGTANITTGQATATGSIADTDVDQAAATGDSGGLTVAVQDSDVVNAGAAASNSGGNVGIGNASTNVAANGQLAAGLLASNQASASNTSNGTANIATGAATATGNLSSTDIDQSVDLGDSNGVLDLLVQDTDVLNLGVAAANSGGNIGIGNASTNIAATGQGAFGLFAASNGSSTSNTSNGTANIATGAATATGNKSKTTVDQTIDGDPGNGGLGLVIQNAPVLNAGIGVANSGLDIGVGNASVNVDLLAQISFGLLSSNSASSNSWSDGFTTILTGTATGVGNDSITAVTQES